MVSKAISPQGKKLVLLVTELLIPVLDPFSGFSVPVCDKPQHIAPPNIVATDSGYIH